MRPEAWVGCGVPLHALRSPVAGLLFSIVITRPCAVCDGSGLPAASRPWAFRALRRLCGRPHLAPAWAGVRTALMTHRTIAIVGAGIAGLACAARLAAGGHGATLFDKARGPGGRMSTRRVETAQGQACFDHGAQYFTARHPKFSEQVRAWAQAGVVAPWPAAGTDAWVGVPGMNAPVRLLAEAHDVHWSTPIESLERHGDRWSLQGQVPLAGVFDAVVVAVPAEQAVPLVVPFDASMAARASAAHAAPCWTVMASFESPLPITTDTLRAEGVLGWAARNSSKPQRHGPEAWVLQAAPRWSQEHLEDSPDQIVECLLAALAECSGIEMPMPAHASAHRWRYARYDTGNAGEGMLWNPALGLGACGDWLLGPRVECAWLTGDRLGEAVHASLR